MYDVSEWDIKYFEHSVVVFSSGNVAGALKRKCGPELVRECDKKGNICDFVVFMHLPICSE